jgi:hypothetical protein
MDISALNQLQNEKEMHIWDRNKYNYVAENADIKLYQYYKNIDRVLEQNQVSKFLKKNIVKIYNLTGIILIQPELSLHSNAAKNV